MFKSVSFILLVLAQCCVFASPEKAFHPSCQSKIAGDYAALMANKQFTKKGEFAKAPFKIQTFQEVTELYFQAQGYTPEKIKDIETYSPVAVYAVSLRSANQWDCEYYVTLKLEAERKCTFSSVSFDHCAKG
jgi:hypothetical protein